MKKRLVFNLADRDKYFESLKLLHGGGYDAEYKEEENRQEADSQSENSEVDSERVSGV